MDNKYYTYPCGCKFLIRKEESGQLPELDFNVRRDTEKIRYDCPETWKLLAEGRTLGIFQLDSELGRNWSKRLKPSSIDDLGALGALLRPGCLNAKDEKGISLTAKYCQRKHKEEPVQSFHPDVDKLLRDTFNIVVYQEQFMAIAREIADFSLLEVDKLRKAAGKKNQQEMSEIMALFEERAMKKGILSKEQIDLVVSNIKATARYSFNKCLVGDTKVLISRAGDKVYRPMKVSSLFERFYDYTHCESESVQSIFAYSKTSTNKIVRNHITFVSDQGVQCVYKMQLDNGQFVTCTLNHKFPTNLGELTLNKIIENHCSFDTVRILCCDNLEYPTKGKVNLHQIDWIACVGWEKVYDVTMEGPNHNFVLDNGIITSNSHAIGYGKETYWMAYEKTHFPIRFFTSHLKRAKGNYKQTKWERINDLVNDAKSFNIEFALPDIRDNRPTFYIKNNKIYFGLGNVKNVGESTANDIQKVVAEYLAIKPMDSFMDFLVFGHCNKLSKSIFKLLIDSGALNCFGKTKDEMNFLNGCMHEMTDNHLNKIKKLINYKKFNDYGDFIDFCNENDCFVQKRTRDLFSNYVKLYKSKKFVDDITIVSEVEEEMLGCPIANFKTEKYTLENVNATCKQIFDGKEGKCIVACELVKVVERETKTGDNAGRKRGDIYARDSSLMLKMSVWYDEWEKFKHLMLEKNNLVMLVEKSKSKKFDTVFVRGVWELNNG